MSGHPPGIAQLPCGTSQLIVCVWCRIAELEKPTRRQLLDLNAELETEACSLYPALMEEGTIKHNERDIFHFTASRCLIHNYTSALAASLPLALSLCSHTATVARLPCEYLYSYALESQRLI